MRATRQQAVLDAMTPGECLPFADLVARLPGLDRRAAGAGVSGLVAKGYARRVERGCYELTAEGVAAKQQGQKMTHEPGKPLVKPGRTCLRTRVWGALRRLRGLATYQQIATLACTGREKEPEVNIRHYLRALWQAGFLYRQAGAYRLVRNSGPLAPMWRATRKIVHDPNTSQDWPTHGEASHA